MNEPQKQPWRGPWEQPETKGAPLVATRRGKLIACTMVGATLIAGLSPRSCAAQAAAPKASAAASEQQVRARLIDCVMHRDLLAIGHETVPDAEPSLPEVRSLYLAPDRRSFQIGLRLPQPRVVRMSDMYIPASITLSSDRPTFKVAAAQLQLHAALRQVCLPYGLGTLKRADAVRQIAVRHMGAGVRKIVPPLG